MAEKDEAVGLSALQHQCVTLLSPCFVLGVPKEYGIALTMRHIFDALKD